MRRRTAARSALLALVGAASPAAGRVGSARAQAEEDPTPWARPGPYLTPAGFDGFDLA